jgi:excinuclease ABC subunit A
VVFVDQSPIGKTARSNPASYVGAWDAIRKLFADAPLARQRGYTRPSSASTRATGAAPPAAARASSMWRCSSSATCTCAAPTATASATAPRSWRCTSTAIEVDRSAADALAAVGEGRIWHLNVADVLDLTVAEAVQVFARDREVLRALQPIVDVGLDYVRLGQPVPTLSAARRSA